MQYLIVSLNIESNFSFLAVDISVQTIMDLLPDEEINHQTHYKKNKMLFSFKTS